MGVSSFATKLKKGQVGERVIIERLEKIGCDPQDLTDYQIYKKYQQKGLDFTFLDRKLDVRLRGDSKANIIFSKEDDNGMTFMELTKKTGDKGWFETSKSDYIFIYDPLYERSFFYDLEIMRNHFEDKRKNHNLKVIQLKDGCYGVWQKVDQLIEAGLIKELKA